MVNATAGMMAVKNKIMGTNYYTKTEKCSKCGHQPEGIHLGKSSAGWRFSFQYNGGVFYKNIRQMKNWLKDKKIEDEYGAEISYDKFWEMVRVKQMFAEKELPEKVIKIDGYNFFNYEFS